MAVTITIGGKKGVESAQPFSIRDPQPGLANPDRPVWILADTYPRIAGMPGPGGAQTSNKKTFDFGELKPGRGAGGRLEARGGEGRRLQAPLPDRRRAERQQKAVNADGGGTPTGSFAVRIALKPQLTRINSKGEIVPVQPSQASGGAQASTGGGGGGGNPNATSGTANGGSGSYPPSGSLPPSGSGY